MAAAVCNSVGGPAQRLRRHGARTDARVSATAVCDNGCEGERKMGDGFDTRLLTAEGHFVTRVRIPLFNRPPEIVRWVERFFMRRLNGEYREAMVWPCDVDPENREPCAE
jgi:hypothetical protein